MNRTDLKDRVERLGQLREELHKIKGAERELSAEVLTAMRAGGRKPVESQHYLACIAVRQVLEIPPAKLERLAKSRRAWLECVQVNVKAARRHFTDAQLRGIGKQTEQDTLRISPK